VEVEGEPTLNALCNCDDCRRRTGAPFSWSVYFPNEQVRGIEGPLTTRTVTSMAGEATRSFCARCGSTLFWASEVFMPGQTGFAAGCFNDPDLPAPAFVACYAQRMPWAVFPADCMVVDV
jgi:hypothetical protein